ncbi:exodeoxyribonuclease VII small subunit [Pelistega europaea]|uniref:Exodeoxyribonuclease 7 small subunit n=2 Tax=Pelistega europaea TaxID=106147 RepID=A0A7Y4LBP3_9BURK|nr:exodeoxyribonuclease VII small subunit [Pelistega europaea]NOL49492.1 exodeoxyribonuclease VII small subunit [Pelistega europaea]
MANTKSAAKQDLPTTFEEALAELEQIVQSMEDEMFTLEESLKAYERGVLLTKVCQEKLDAANQQVQVLQNNLLRPMDNNEEDQQDIEDTDSFIDDTPF